LEPQTHDVVAELVMADGPSSAGGISGSSQVPHARIDVTTKTPPTLN
jgi:hypothetical protein